MEGDESAAPRAAELQLRHCLDARTRRWVAAEFFCSAIDRPWFLHNPLQARSRLKTVSMSWALHWSLSAVPALRCRLLRPAHGASCCWLSVWPPAFKGRSRLVRAARTPHGSAPLPEAIKGCAPRRACWRT